MMYEQTIAALALIAGILSKHDRRSAVLCFGFAAVIFIWNYLFGSPADFRSVGYSWWFVSCGCGEATIMIMAWIAMAPASPWVAILSSCNLVMDLLAGAVYRFAPHHPQVLALWGPISREYRIFIPTTEAIQVLTLFLFSWPVIEVAKIAFRWVKRRHRGGWKWLTVIRS